MKVSSLNSLLFIIRRGRRFGKVEQLRQHTWAFCSMI